MAKQPDAQQLQIIAAVADLVGRTGATDFNVEWHELENAGPKGPRIVWFVYAGYPSGIWEVGASHSPVKAAIRCAEAVVEGGRCTHCNRMTTVDDRWQNPIPHGDDAPWCAYVYDPSTNTFVRSCA